MPKQCRGTGPARSDGLLPVAGARLKRSARPPASTPPRRSRGERCAPHRARIRAIPPSAAPQPASWPGGIRHHTGRPRDDPPAPAESPRGW